MKRILLTVLLTGALTGLGTLSLGAQSFSDVAGKWTLKKNSNLMGDVTQNLELKDDKFTYQVVGSDGATVLFARGKVKVERLGPFKVMRLTDIEGGTSQDYLEPVYDDRAVIYTSGWRTLTVAVNFDRSRDGEEPVADTYKLVKD